MEKTKHSLIRTIYLYLFALVGLVLLVIGTVNFINMALKAYVFTKAEDEERLYKITPPMPERIDQVKEIAQGEEVKLTNDQLYSIKSWLIDYQTWKERSEKIDPILSRRHRDASINLSLIIVGLPLFLYHWRIIRKETKNK
ncbi:MAG: hypothetical protein ABIF84_02640 [Patescibacteria group bacterium]